jgi:hypothetical protein
MKLSETTVVLLLLYINERSPIIGKTKFQKLVYVYEEECHKQLGLHKKLNLNEINLFSFRPYNYGPFSDKLVEVLKTLVSTKYIQEEIEKNAFLFDDSYGERISYSISDIGARFVEEKILEYLDTYILEKLSDFKNMYTKMTTLEIITYVYNKYENMTINSLIKDEIMKKDNIDRI